MTTTRKAKAVLKGKSRMRSEIVDAMCGLNKIGAVSRTELDKVTLKMLGRDALPKVPVMTPAEIVKVREKAGLSQAVLAGYLNVAVNTVSQWERGERNPTGAALKLLQVVKQNGIQVLR